MDKTFLNWCGNAVLLMLTTLSLAGGAYAHDAKDLSPFTINQSNNGVLEKVVQVQTVLTQMLRGASPPAHWPGQQLSNLLNQMNDLKEDIGLSLQYFEIKGVDIQSDTALRQNPQAGRTVAGSRAVDTAVALMQHAKSLGSQAAFVKDVYSHGLSFYMYDLLGAYRDKMELYKMLMPRTKQK